MEVQFVFYPDLNSFLTYERRSGSFTCSFNPGQSLKHLVESAGVPHTEVGIIRANGVERSLDDPGEDTSRVEVFPADEHTTARPAELRFVLDSHLGRLAAYLRMLGLDALYSNDFADEALAAISAEQERILLTRDRRLLMRKIVGYGACLRSLDPRAQLDEVVKRYRLKEAIRPFRRCLRCNAPLDPVSKAEILDRLEPLTKQYFDEFHICPSCGQIYWKGSHFDRMQAILDELSRS